MFLLQVMGTSATEVKNIKIFDILQVTVNKQEFCKAEFVAMKSLIFGVERGIENYQRPCYAADPMSDVKLTKNRYINI